MIGLDERLLCARTLIRSAESGSYGNLAMKDALRHAESLDAALCIRLLQGTTERLITLDACIAAHVKGNPEKLDTPVRAVLRCGIYELLYLNTPESAAVNLWTECVKRLKKTSAAGLVNAVLRGFLRGGKKIPMPQDPLRAMSVAYSVPVPLTRLLQKDYDAETVEAFLSDALNPPPIYVRRNPLAASEAEFLAALPNAEPVPGIPCAYRLERGDRNAAKLLESDSRLHVQDLASQLCCLALDAQPGETVQDVCAAPGGKTFTIAENMRDEGEILAFDLHENRVRLIRQGAKRLHLNCIRAVCADASNAERPPADRVLCDVPCSGYGVIRRKPEIRYKAPESTENLPEIQYRILEASAAVVKPGGVLVYSTCTVLKRENEDVVRRFLAAHPEFHPEKPWQNLPALAKYGQEMTTLFPAMCGSDGFFIAKLRKAT